MSDLFSRFLRFIFLLILFICIIFVPILYSDSVEFNNISNSDIYSSYGFLWPIPGYTSISSYFGRRTSPTAYASSYHSGLDIPAPEGTSLYAIEDGIITFCSWGAGRRIYYCFRTYKSLKC